MSDVLENIRGSYLILERRVQSALYTQLGDVAQLTGQREQVLRFFNTASQVRIYVSSIFHRITTIKQHQNLFPPNEFSVLQQNITTMMEYLDQGCHLSADLPDETLQPITSQLRTGHRGRPRIDIDPGFLTEAYTLRGPTGIAPVVQACARTVRRRALDLGIVSPGHPVRQRVQQANGTERELYTYTSTAPPVSTFSDEQLDTMIREILTSFPDFGRKLIEGRLRTSGHRVPRDRVVASYARVHGPGAIFGDCTIHRQKYNVRGANSVWHHDGQHGTFIITIITGRL